MRDCSKNQHLYYHTHGPLAFSMRAPLLCHMKMGGHSHNQHLFPSCVQLEGWPRAGNCILPPEQHPSCHSQTQHKNHSTFRDLRSQRNGKEDCWESWATRVQPPLCDKQRQETTHKTGTGFVMHALDEQHMAQLPSAPEQTLFVTHKDRRWFTRPATALGYTRPEEWHRVQLFSTHEQNRMRDTWLEEWQRAQLFCFFTHTSRTLCDICSRKNGVGGTTIFHHTDGRFLTRPALHWWCTQAEEWLRTRSHCEAWPSSHRGRHTWPEHG